MTNNNQAISTVFNFNQHFIKTLDIDGQVYFKAADITKALGFKNSRQAIDTHVDAEDVQFLDTLTNGGKQKVNFVNESGMYALIFGSTKPQAKLFKKWVTSEVLPTIRKTGQYQVAKPPRIAKSTKYHYPRNMLDQPYFVLPKTGKANLSLHMLANTTEFVSPLMALLNQMRSEGHEVTAPFDEAVAMRTALQKAEAAFEAISDCALRGRLKTLE
ncbi:MAG: BRO family protein [Hydrogenophaga sp.]|nr:BRO family protein [Hydrogenophaga sp.]